MPAASVARGEYNHIVKAPSVGMGLGMWPDPGSNRGPFTFQANALPTELSGREALGFTATLTRLELATSAVTGRRANQLRHRAVCYRTRRNYTQRLTWAQITAKFCCFSQDNRPFQPSYHRPNRKATSEQSALVVRPSAATWIPSSREHRGRRGSTRRN